MRFSKLCQLPYIGLPLALVALAQPAAADPGLVVLKNGDRITGDIAKIWDGEIYIEPEYADEFAVDMDAVAWIQSEADFEVMLTDGTEFTASLRGQDADGNQLLVIDGTERALPLATLEELNEIEDYREWDSRADVAAAVNKGNTDSQNLRVGLGTDLKLGDHRHGLDLTFIREEQDGVSTKEQDLYQYNYNWLFSDPWFLGALGSYEKDPIRLLDYRYILGSGLGRDIWANAGRTWNVQAGIGYQQEKIDGQKEDNTIGYWIMRFAYDFLAGDLEFYHTDSAYTNLSGRNNTVLKTKTGFRYDIIDDVYANFEVAYDYETDPGETAEKDDLAVLLGIGAEF